MTTLKSGDTADAKHETGKAEKLKGLLPVAREAMEHTTGQVVGILAEYVQ